MVNLPVLLVYAAHDRLLHSRDDYLPEVAKSRVADLGRYWSRAVLPHQIMADDTEPVKLTDTLYWKPNEGINVSISEYSRPERQEFSDKTWEMMHLRNYLEYYTYCVEQGQGRDSIRKSLIAGLDADLKETREDFEEDSQLYKDDLARYDWEVWQIRKLGETEQ